MDKTATKIKNKDKPNDVFYTPITAVNIHLKLVDEYVKENDMIFDPFFGSGRYYNRFLEFNKNNHFDWSEIELGKDFFEYNKNVDVIISNPPYSCIDKVFEKSVSLNPHTISYLIGSQNFTPKRVEYMNSKGYFLVKLHYMKIYKWFGHSVICVFSKNGSNCISFDRIVHR
jgi:DNA modification methylase